MAELDAERTSPRRVDRSWNLALLTAAEPGRRNRRTIDAAFLIIASVVTGLAATVARLAPDIDADIARALATVVGWAPNVWRATFVFTLAVALVIFGDAILRRRWVLVRDLVVGLVVVLVVGALLGRVVNRSWSLVEPHVFSNWGFPEFRLACAVAIFAIAGPELCGLPECCPLSSSQLQGSVPPSSGRACHRKFSELSRSAWARARSSD